MTWGNLRLLPGYWGALSQHICSTW